MIEYDHYGFGTKTANLQVGIDAHVPGTITSPVGGATIFVLDVERFERV